MTLPPLGPLLDEDVALLQAVIKMTSPKVLVEFGFFHGKSAQAMLDVMLPDARLVSYDNTQSGSEVRDSRFTFKRKSQTEFEPMECVDFVFVDASHDLALNKETWRQIVDCLSPTAIVAIHDTGLWVRNAWGFDRGYTMPDGRYTHCPDERMFVNYLKEEYPEFQQIHLHSDTELRHGITLLQKYNKLDV